METQGRKGDFQIVRPLMEKLTRGSRLGIYRRINKRNKRSRAVESLLRMKRRFGGIE